jgi:hypothetical protein
MTEAEFCRNGVILVVSPAIGYRRFSIDLRINQTRPTASTVKWWGPAQQPANAEIVPLCAGGGCT